MFTFRRLVLSLTAAVTAVDPLASNINGKLFAHMLPQFEAEEVAQMAKSEKPVVGGETVYSLEDAVAKVRKLMTAGHITEEKGEKLIHSLIAAEQLKKIASVMQLQSKSLSAVKAEY